MQKDHPVQSTATKLQLLMQKNLKARSSETNPGQVTQNTVPVTATTTLADTQTSVLCSSVCLLKTAMAKVVLDVGSAIANILFDEGAQCSFISKKLANALKLTPRRNKNISLALFGVDPSTPQHLDVTAIKNVSHTGDDTTVSVSSAKDCCPSSVYHRFQVTRASLPKGPHPSTPHNGGG